MGRESSRFRRTVWRRPSISLSLAPECSMCHESVELVLDSSARIMVTLLEPLGSMYLSSPHFFLNVALLTIFRSGYMAHIIIQYDNTPCAHNNLIAGQIIFRCQYYVALDVAGVLPCAAYCLVPLKIVSNFIPTKGPNVRVGEG